MKHNSGSSSKPEPRKSTRSQKRKATEMSEEAEKRQKILQSCADYTAGANDLVIDKISVKTEPEVSVKIEQEVEEANDTSTSFAISTNVKQEPEEAQDIVVKEEEIISDEEETVTESTPNGSYFCENDLQIDRKPSIVIEVNGPIAVQMPVEDKVDANSDKAPVITGEDDKEEASVELETPQVSTAAVGVPEDSEEVEEPEVMTVTDKPEDSLTTDEADFPKVLEETEPSVSSNEPEAAPDLQEEEQEGSEIVIESVVSNATEPQVPQVPQQVTDKKPRGRGRPRKIRPEPEVPSVIYDNYNCQVEPCKIPFSSKIALKKHMKAVHPDVVFSEASLPTFRCQDCGKTLQTKKGVEVHQTYHCVKLRDPEVLSQLFRDHGYSDL